MGSLLLSREGDGEIGAVCVVIVRTQDMTGC